MVRVRVHPRKGPVSARPVVLLSAVVWLSAAVTAAVLPDTVQPVGVRSVAAQARPVLASELPKSLFCPEQTRCTRQSGRKCKTQITYAFIHPLNDFVVAAPRTPGECLSPYKWFNLQNSDFCYNPKNRFNPYASSDIEGRARKRKRR